HIDIGALARRDEERRHKVERKINVLDGAINRIEFVIHLQGHKVRLCPEGETVCLRKKGEELIPLQRALHLWTSELAAYHVRTARTGRCRPRGTSAVRHRHPLVKQKPYQPRRDARRPRQQGSRSFLEPQPRTRIGFLSK